MRGATSAILIFLSIWFIFENRAGRALAFYQYICLWSSPRLTVHPTSPLPDPPLTRNRAATNDYFGNRLIGPLFFE